MIAGTSATTLALDTSASLLSNPNATYYYTESLPDFPTAIDPARLRRGAPAEF